MDTILLARHRETEWNVSDMFRGRTNIELQQTSLQQARLLAEYVSAMRIDAGLLRSGTVSTTNPCTGQSMIDR
jgi:broad specificity phosphatase PhoE